MHHERLEQLAGIAEVGTQPLASPPTSARARDGSHKCRFAAPRSVAAERRCADHAGWSSTTKMRVRASRYSRTASLERVVSSRASVETETSVAIERANAVMSRRTRIGSRLGLPCRCRPQRWSRHNRGRSPWLRERRDRRSRASRRSSCVRAPPRKSSDGATALGDSPVKQSTQRHTPIGVPAFEQRHRAHSQPCEPSGTRVPYRVRSRCGRTGQDELPALATLVDFSTDSIPKLGGKSCHSSSNRGTSPLEHQCRIHGDQPADRRVCIEMCRTRAELGSGCGLPAGLRSFDQDRARASQRRREFAVGDSRVVRHVVLLPISEHLTASRQFVTIPVASL